MRQFPTFVSCSWFPLAGGTKDRGERKQHHRSPVNVSPKSPKISWGALNFPSGKEWDSQLILYRPQRMGLHKDSEAKVLIKLPNDLDLENEVLS